MITKTLMSKHTLLLIAGFLFVQLKIFTSSKQQNSANHSRKPENLKSFKMMVDASYQPEIPTWYGPGSAELSTGTTLVAFEFADGVVMAADSRTSTGSFVAVRVTDKLTPVTSHIMACR